jgi:tetrahydromethanopterin S-methyltransferase subunit B
LKDQLDNKVFKVFLVSKDLQEVLLDNKEQLVPLDHKEIQEQMEQLVILDHKEIQEQMEQTVPLDHKEIQEQMEQLVQLDHKEQSALLDYKE